MKKTKKIAIFCLAALFTIGASSLAVACGKDDKKDNGNSSVTSSIDLNTPATAYRFKIVDQNGAPVAGYVVQLCKSTCLFSQPTDANGEVSFGGDATEGATDYDIHVFTADPTLGNGGEQVTYTGTQKTPAAYSHDIIVLVIQK